MSETPPSTTAVTARRDADDDEPFAGTARLVMIWHVVGAMACLVGVLLARRVDGDNVLPGTMRTVLTTVFTLLFAGHAVAAAGIGSTAKWSRPLSLVVNYLLVVVAGASTLHQLDAFRAIGYLGQGLYDAWLPFLVACVGVLWVLIAGQLKAKAPTAPGPRRLRQAGWSLAGGAMVWFTIAAGPGGAINALVDSLTNPSTLGALALAVGAALACRAMWSREAARHFDNSASTEDTLSGLAFLSPNLIGFAAFFIGPLIFSLYMAFTNSATTGGGEWVGLENFTRALSLDFASADASGAGNEVLKGGYQVLWKMDWFGQHWVVGARDPVFWQALWNIIFFLVFAVPLAVLPALFLSSILASKLPGMKVFRAIYFIPSVAGVIGVAIIWSQMFDASIGWINYLLDLIGLTEAGSGPAWLSQRWTARFAMVMVFAWMNFGFNTVLYLAGHQGIPKELYEAAEIDGANVWQTFRKITVPQLRNTTFYVLVTTSILALQLFDIVWILSRPEPGGPNNATVTPVLRLYREAFQNNSIGSASAMAWVLFALIFAFTFFQFRQQRDEATAGGVS